MTDGEGLYIALISLHGLIRGEEPELGRDADTGGQVLYVLDLARALAAHPDVSRVELMTRQILSTNVDHSIGRLVDIQTFNQVSQDVPNRDGLRLRINPARCDHDG